MSAGEQVIPFRSQSLSQLPLASFNITPFSKSDSALIDPQNHVLSEKEIVTMKSVSLTDAERDEKLDQLSAELASSVYQVTLRETTPQSWLELELDLWKAISNKLETKYTDIH